MAAKDFIEIQAGLKKLILATGDGTQLQPGDKVTVHCTGKLSNGNKFWSTRDPGQQPFTFSVGEGQVIPGWDYGCLSMQVGEKAELHMDAVLGYGPSGFPAWGIPPNTDLIFEIEVISSSRK